LTSDYYEWQSHGNNMSASYDNSVPMGSTIHGSSYGYSTTQSYDSYCDYSGQGSSKTIESTVSSPTRAPESSSRGLPGYDAAQSYSQEPSLPMDKTYVDTEKRKLLIKGISYKATEEDIQRLVRNAAGGEAESIVVPKDSSGGLKYIALALFPTQEVALRVERKLNHAKFKGHELTVRFTNEGVSAGETGASVPETPTPTKTSQHSKRKDKEKGKDREKDRDRRSMSSKSASNPHQEKKGCDRDRGRDRDREASPNWRPLIADGSSKIR
jgi:RNA recognition motif-containing protein